MIEPSHDEDPAAGDAGDPADPAAGDPAAADAVGDDIAEAVGDDIAEALRRIDLALAEIRAELADANGRAAARERVIDRLHEENQRLRTGERQLLLRPVVVDLYRLRDDLLRQASSLPEGISATQLAALLESFAYSVEQTLERCGVQLIRPTAGEEFDPRRHRATGVARAGHPDQDGRVAEVLADGYLDNIDGGVLSSAAVLVARWTPPAEPDTGRYDDSGDDQGGPPAPS